MHDLSCSPEPVQSLAVLVRQLNRPRRLEQGNSKMQRYQQRQALLLRRNRKNQKEQKMVAECKTNSRLLKKVAEIYNWLDSQTRRYSDLAGRCDACGKCCDFNAFDHHLFVTTPELIYLAAKLAAENIKAMPTTRCPYQTNGKCTIYKHRFAGCRIFCCKADADFQSRLSESALKKFKSISTDLQIPYRYTGLAAALNTFAH